jgi:pilus assembly protein CpaC
MNNRRITYGARFGGIMLSALATTMLTLSTTASPVSAQVTTERTNSDISLSKGRAQIVNLPVAISDVVVSNPEAVDVQVKSPRQIVVFGKGDGESSVFATTKDGRVVYSTNVRVVQNANSLDDMLKIAMPDATLKSTTMNGMILLTGTVATPDDAAEAERLAKAFVGDEVQVLSRLKTATPMQVMLQVKIAEVNRDFLKKVGVNYNAGGLSTNKNITGPKFNSGRDFVTITPPAIPADGTPPLVGSSFDFKVPEGLTSLAFAKRFLGVDFAAALDLAESDGLAVTLAQPTLTALSGETASFLAGGEIPFTVAGSLGTNTIEYKQYGISLAFTPFVLSDGRISMRVRPEVSQIAANVSIGGSTLPSLNTRRIETSVELGSGQSMILGGLLSNSQNSAIERVPGVGNVPVLGALFRSSSYRRNETELVIVVTPYLVKPVNANDIALPTDGYRSASDLQRIGLGNLESSKSGGDRPKPSMGDPVTVPTGPSFGGGQPAPAAPEKPTKASRKKAKLEEREAAQAAPGFGY